MVDGGLTGKVAVVTGSAGGSVFLCSKHAAPLLRATAGCAIVNLVDGGWTAK